MTPKEQTRLKILNSLLAEHMTLDQAATLMGVSPRHTRRILAVYQEKGAATVAHGLRGRKPANATPEPVATAVVHLARTRYAGTNHTHLSELLSDRDGIDIGRTTLRRILVNAGFSSPRRRRQPKHRVRRQRMPRQGMLIQMDGSHHSWLGDRIPPFTLLIAVDDATGTVADALFCEKEAAHSWSCQARQSLSLSDHNHDGIRGGNGGRPTTAAPADLDEDVELDVLVPLPMPRQCSGPGLSWWISWN